MVKEKFELSKFDEYREDNRREVKSARGWLPNSLWDTYSAMAKAMFKKSVDLILNC